MYHLELEIKLWEHVTVLQLYNMVKYLKELPIGVFLHICIVNRIKFLPPVVLVVK